MRFWFVVVGLIVSASACDRERSPSADPSTSAGSEAGSSAGAPHAGAAAGGAGVGVAGPAAAAASGGADTAGARAGGSAGAAGMPPTAVTSGKGGDGATPLNDAGTVVDPEDDAGAPPVEDAGTSPPECPDCCPDGFPRGNAGGSLRKLAGLTPSPEGVAVCPDGNVFVALDGSGELWRIPLDGAQPERWAKLGDRRPAGLTCDARGRLFVAIFSTLSGKSAPVSAVMVTGRDTEPVALPQPDDGSVIGGLNGIVAVDGVGVYASDANANTILLMREPAPGTFATQIVARDVTLANGLAYDAAKRTLYAVASGAGQVLSYAVATDGALGGRKQVSVSALILFMDGVAVDEHGTIYVADYLGGGVIRAKDGVRVAPAARGGSAGLTNPASFAFRGGTLLITDYHVMAPEQAGGLYAIDLGVCGGQP